MTSDKKDNQRTIAWEDFRELVLDGMSSGEGSDLDDAYFTRLHERIANSQTNN